MIRVYFIFVKGVACSIPLLTTAVHTYRFSHFLFFGGVSSLFGSFMC